MGYKQVSSKFGFLRIEGRIVMGTPTGIGLALLATAHAFANEPTKSQQSPTTPLQIKMPLPPEDVLLSLIRQYRQAMALRSLEKLASLVDPELLVVENGHKNVGWADYRDHHIGPEMQEWSDFQVINERNLEVRLVGDLGYAVTEATYRITLAARAVVLAATETFVFRKSPTGWKIKHIHFSAPKPKSAP
jgi:ketosteroid isomerase-like protein